MNIPVNHNILLWARKEAGYSPAQVVELAKITSPKQRKNEPQVSPEQRLDAWEQGNEIPTLPQLEKLADVYRRPLITFFLKTPPAASNALADFRTIQGGHAVNDSPEFSALKRRIIALHRELVNLTKEEGKPINDFVGSMKDKSSIDEIVKAIRNKLRLSFEEQKKQNTETELLRLLRVKSQEVGIFVLMEGNLGSHHSNISPDEFRGISIADPLAPIIVINPNDAKAANVFTFVHELCHIWLGASGVSNLNALSTNHAHKKQEILCNAVAAEFLVPKQSISVILKESPSFEGEEMHSYIDRLAKQFKISGAVIGRRLADLGIISSTDYNGLLSFYKKRWEKQKEKTPKKEGGPDRNRLDRYRLGDSVIRTITSAAYEGRISLQDASRMLNVPVSRFSKVAS